VNLDFINNFSLSLPGTEASFPFDETTLVFKVMGKMFCITDIRHAEEITVKVIPEEGVRLKESYEHIRSGYHMNNKHWITVTLEGLPEVFILQLIQNSYRLVVQKLPKKDRILIEQS
jgi:predicted DNA-binding protein (MmcQ/YjbR family)